MSLQFYIGASGSGKSYELYDKITLEAIENPQKNYLIVVPDQFTMQTQLEMVQMAKSGIRYHFHTITRKSQALFALIL